MKNASANKIKSALLSIFVVAGFLGSSLSAQGLANIATPMFTESGTIITADGSGLTNAPGIVADNKGLNVELSRTTGANNQLHLKMSIIPDQNTQIKIYNAANKLVLFESWNGNGYTNTVDIIMPDKTKTGTYRVEVIRNGEKLSEKIVVE